MKNFIVILIVSIIALTSCSTFDSKEDKAIKNYMMEHLKDPQSYEPVKTIRVTEANVNDIFVGVSPTAEETRDVVIEHDRLLIETGKEGGNFYHKFRAKNGYGGYGFAEYVFTFDENYNPVAVFDLKDLVDIERDWQREQERKRRRY